VGAAANTASALFRGNVGGCLKEEVDDFTDVNVAPLQVGHVLRGALLVFASRVKGNRIFRDVHSMWEW
jgi:hypothetical protein